MIILIGSQKGGCGKSTTAINMCAELSQRGKDIVLVDADLQSTSANWALDREEKKFPAVHCIQRYENIRETLLDLNKRYEFVIVDAAGRDSRELRTGITAAHIMIIPFRPSQPDLDTLPKIQNIITQGKYLNTELIVYALLTMAPTNPVINESKEAIDYLSDYPDIKLLNTIVRDRKVYRDAISEGMGVVEMNNRKAEKEIKDLVKEVLNGKA